MIEFDVVFFCFCIEIGDVEFGVMIVVFYVYFGLCDWVIGSIFVN